MGAITCTSSGGGDFSIVLDGTVFNCVSDSPPIVLVGSGMMTQQDFNELWPPLMLLLVLGFCGWAVRKMLM